jgi:putative membrane protein
VRFLLRMLVSAAVIFGVAYLTNGYLVPEMPFVTALALAIVLALVNAVIKPIVSLIALPVTILTLGLFSLVINALMLYLGEIVVAVGSTGFWRTVLAALVISIVTSLLTRLVIDRDEE